MPLFPCDASGKPHRTHRFKYANWPVRGSYAGHCSNGTKARIKSSAVFAVVDATKAPACGVAFAAGVAPPLCSGGARSVDEEDDIRRPNPASKQASKPRLLSPPPPRLSALPWSESSGSPPVTLEKGLKDKWSSPSLRSSSPASLLQGGFGRRDVGEEEEDSSIHGGKTTRRT